MTEGVPSTVHHHNGDEDADSAVGDIEPFSESDNDSVLSETEDYIEENGRFYHAPWIDGQYLLPNDGREQKRLKIQHQYLLNINGLHKAPLPKGIHNVFDVGTGTGDWADDFAEAYPSAVITAVDISPNVMPTHVDPNCNFLVDDAENGLGLGNNEFDYIHVRLLHGFRNPARFIRHALEALVPGGYLEITEFEFPLQFHDPETAKNSDLMIWLANVTEGGFKLGIDLTITDKIFGMLENGGFEDIEESISAWPIGAWPKKKKRAMLGANLQDYWLLLGGHSARWTGTGTGRKLSVYWLRFELKYAAKRSGHRCMYALSGPRSYNSVLCTISAQT